MRDRNIKIMGEASKIVKDENLWQSKGDKGCYSANRRGMLVKKLMEEGYNGEMEVSYKGKDYDLSDLYEASAFLKARNMW